MFPSAAETKKASPKKRRGGSSTSSSSSSSSSASASEKQFPGKLHDLLTYAERENLDDIISWVSNGRAFKVHKPDKIVDILGLFFGQTKFRSFQRQLNGWHFERILHGPERGGFFHPYFVRGNKSLCSYMSRHRQASNNDDNKPTIMSWLRIDATKMLQPHSELPALSSPPPEITFKESMDPIFNEIEDETITPANHLQSTSTGQGENTFNQVFKNPLNDDLDDDSIVDFEHKYFRSLDESCFEIDQLPHDALDQSLWNLGIEQESTSISQLLEPISQDAFDTLFVL